MLPSRISFDEDEELRLHVQVPPPKKTPPAMSNSVAASPIAAVSAALHHAKVLHHDLWLLPVWHLQNTMSSHLTW